VSVTFKPTNSTYSFYRLAGADDMARLGPVSFAGVQHAGRDTEDYLEVAATLWLIQNLDRRIEPIE
jgi:hypothetical protein